MSEGAYIITGLSRLTVRVAGALLDRAASVIVVASPGELDLRPLLREGVDVLPFEGDREAALRAAGVVGAACVLALGEDDLENLRSVVTADAVAPGVPVVLRAFDPALADQVATRMNLRRAFSVSALAAPAFIAAALGSEVVQTMRLGEDEVPLARLSVAPGSPLAGLSPPEVKSAFGCAVFAWAGPDGAWRPVVGSGGTVPEGGAVMVGGPLLPVLRLARLNAEEAGVTPARRKARLPRRERHRRRRRRSSLVPLTAAALVAVLITAVIVYAVALHIGPIDAVYAAIITAFGSPTLSESQDWLKVFGVSSMIVGGILIGILFAHLTALATAERLEERMGRRARQLSGHAIVAGLGTIGYRLEQLLHDLGIAVAGIDRAPDARFSGAIEERTPVLTGDVRLRENLERAGIHRAAFLFALTSDDLVNVEACVQAERINPRIRTVARIFDEAFAAHAGPALGIDGIVSATTAAAGAFVAAATDERALRPFRVGPDSYTALRYDVAEALTLEGIERWWAQGVRVLGFRRGTGPVQPASELTEALAPGDTAIVAGPEPAVLALVHARDT
jgi:Trk K+ transport system NAD-binding subunit